MKNICHLYSISTLKVLPLSIILVLIYDFIRFSHLFIPQEYKQYQFEMSMIAGILFIPLTAYLWWIIDNIGKSGNASFATGLDELIKRLLSLMGTYFSMLLFPAFMIGVCIGVYVAISFTKAPLIVGFLWLLASYMIVFATIVSKIFAPILVMTDQLDANSAVEQSEQMVKGFFLRTFIHSFYALLFIIFLAKLPSLVSIYFPQISQQVPAYGLEIAAQILLVIFGPWSFALLIAHKHDLALRLSTKEKLKPKQTMKQQPGFKVQKVKKDQVNF